MNDWEIENNLKKYTEHFNKISEESHDYFTKIHGHYLIENEQRDDLLKLVFKRQRDLQGIIQDSDLVFKNFKDTCSEAKELFYMAVAESVCEIIYNTNIVKVFGQKLDKENETRIFNCFRASLAICALHDIDLGKIFSRYIQWKNQNLIDEVELPEHFKIAFNQAKERFDKIDQIITTKTYNGNYIIVILATSGDEAINHIYSKQSFEFIDPYSIFFDNQKAIEKKLIRPKTSLH